MLSVGAEAPKVFGDLGEINTQNSTTAVVRSSTVGQYSLSRFADIKDNVLGGNSALLWVLLNKTSNNTIGTNPACGGYGFPAKLVQDNDGRGQRASDPKPSEV